MPDLLIELFSEEIPARMQAGAREALKKLVTDGLVEAGLTYGGAGTFSTPRRLTLAIEDLSPASRPVSEERKGPRTDAPQAALDGFLRSTGLSIDQLEKRADKKAEVWFAVVKKPGRPASDIVADVLENAIRTFPWPKSMRWGSGTLKWVRPLHSILCILSDESGATVVPLDVDGITSGDSTRGHRFMAPDSFTVTSFEDYAAKLRRAKVMLDQAEREQAIAHGAKNLAFAAGLDVVEDKGLLTEIAGLVEWPVPLMGRIPEAFLGLPPEVLQTSMKEHQKFFSARNPKTGRIEGFVTVANIETPDDGATILAGNLKVLTARLSDARFFWENDLRVAKAGMSEWAEGLTHVTFQSKLGSQSERIARIAALAREIAPLVGADADQAEHAARLAKLDLRSAMVGEFPELQGVMGRYYALEAGEPDAVANAARDHYSPLGPSDAVPSEPVSVAVALADKLDTLTGFWAIDEKPTGSKDPFALRRAALGAIRLVLGNESRVALLPQIRAALEGNFNIKSTNSVYESIVKPNWKLLEAELAAVESSGEIKLPAAVKEALDSGVQHTFDSISDFQDEVIRVLEIAINVPADLLAFFHDRLKVFLKDQGIRHDVIDACLAMPGNDDLTLLVKRATALAETLKSDDGKNLLQGYKRANNILTQAEAKDGVEYSFGPDPKLAETDEERALFTALDQAEAKITPAMAKEDFATAMQAMAELRAPIDAFFTAVQINAENQIIRRNRLNLLHRIRAICSGTADLTKVEG